MMRERMSLLVWLTLTLVGAVECNKGDDFDGQKGEIDQAILQNLRQHGRRHATFFDALLLWDLGSDCAESNS